ncbi:MAG: DUF262 domain-containing protein [Treponema sp.]|nr:DUF262 domain-containing protein [Treponema sp.]
MEQDYKEELTEFGEKAGVIAEDEGTVKDPFAPEDIRISKKVISMDQVVRRLTANTLCLAPEFQRSEVWTQTKKSQLIESLMLNIPIPLFYVAADNTGAWDVVDGLQRLSAIKEFLVDKTLVLSNLEFLGEKYNGKTIDDKDFSPIFFNRIYETEFSFIIIEPGTPDSVKYNIFKRINTGGVFLSAQEIRHALFQGKGTRLLSELAKNDVFLQATDWSINDTRMAAREVILRCLSFMLLGEDGYLNNDNMESFLRKGIQVLNFLDNRDVLLEKKVFRDGKVPEIRISSYNDLKRLFFTSMQRNFELFGKDAFRISKSNMRRSPINKALFDSWGTILAFLPDKDYEKLKDDRDLLIEKYDSKKDDKVFYDAVSRTAWQKSKVDIRFKEIRQLIQDVIG